jgi:UDP:flavonoid glycosyltransferase YjiC (YdhE family)
LKNAGHQVTLATSYNYTEWIESFGISTHPDQFSIQEYMKTPEARKIFASRNIFKLLKAFKEMMGEGPKAVDTIWEAVEDADFVIQSPTSVGALEAAELRGIPAAFAMPVPFAPTGEFVSVFIGPARFSLGGGYNRLTHGLMHKMLWGSMSGPMTKALRKKLGLTPVNSFADQFNLMQNAGIPTLYGFSEHVLPKPIDWDNLQRICGYWFLDSPTDWQPPEDLQQFLAAGPPPVYVGFGSINAGDSEEKTRIILEALTKSEQRGVVLTGWDGLSKMQAPDDIFFIENAPHDWLFPRMAAVVHHGGAGTTGAGLRAGIPNIITPIGADQYFWRERLVQLGVSPHAPSLKILKATELAEAIEIAVSAEEMREKAKALGEKIRGEDGVKRAMNIIKDLL